MGDILDTEAIITKPTGYGRPEAVISKLAGSVGEEYIKIYPSITTTTIINGAAYTTNISSYLGFTFITQRETNFIKMCSTVKEFPLGKSDNVFFHFEDKSSIKCNFYTGGAKIGAERTAFSVISNLQLDHLSKNLVTHIEVWNNKTGMKINCDFSNNVPNYQYETSYQGQRLFQVMGERILGAKYLLVQALG